MNTEEMAVKITELDQRTRSNIRRIDKLEQSTDALHELTLAVREMVVKQDYTKDSIDQLNKKIDNIDGRMEALEQKPAKRWDGIVDKVLLTVVAAIVGFILAQIGIGG